MRAFRVASLLLSSLPLAIVAQVPPPTATAFPRRSGRTRSASNNTVAPATLSPGHGVVLHPPGVFVHDYRITLGNDGLPVQYAMKFSTPGAAAPPDSANLAVRSWRWHGGSSSGHGCISKLGSPIERRRFRRSIFGDRDGRLRLGGRRTWRISRFPAVPPPGQGLQESPMNRCNGPRAPAVRATIALSRACSTRGTPWASTSRSPSRPT